MALLDILVLAAAQWLDELHDRHERAFAQARSAGSGSLLSASLAAVRRTRTGAHGGN
jgi:hypothetical protein